MATDIDKAEDLTKFVAEKKLKLGVARVPDVYKLVAAQGYPTSFAIDVDGNCIWRGHPQMLTDELAEGWLKGMRTPKITRKLAEALSGAVLAYDGVQYGSALTAAEKALKSKDENAKADAQYLLDLLKGRADMHLAAAKIYRDGGWLDKLVALQDSDATDFKGQDYADDCAREAKRVKASKAYKSCVESRDELAKLKETLKDLSPEKARKVLDKLAREYPESPYGKEAAAMSGAIK